MIGTSDGVPYYRAVELFGQEAADFAKSLCSNQGGASMYGIGEDYALEFFTLRGVQTAATYKNITEIRDSGVKGATFE